MFDQLARVPGQRGENPTKSPGSWNNLGVVPNVTQRPPAPSSAPKFLVAVAAVLSALLLAGCGVRLETDVPKPLVPSANELMRQGMVNDLVLIAQDADAAGKSVAADSPTSTELSAVADQASAYQDLLGGVYVSGLPQEEAEQDEVAASPAPATPENVLTRLTDSIARVRSTLPLMEDPELARLFASISISNTLSARDLAAALAQDATDNADAPMVTLEPAAESIPDTVFAGIDPALVTALIVSEDGAGYSYEVLAAMRQPDRRAIALTNATFHRTTAQTWAAVTQVADTAEDPRRVAYDLPLSMSVEAYVAPDSELVEMAQTVEVGLATRYLDLVALAAPENRAFFFDAAIHSALIGEAWGVPRTELPFFTGATEFRAAHEATQE